MTVRGIRKSLTLPSDRTAEQMLERFAEPSQGGGAAGWALDPQPGPHRLHQRRAHFRIGDLVR